MPEDQFSSLPFLTRKMLAFEGAASFQLNVKTRSIAAAYITVRGATKEGPFSFKHITGATGAIVEANYNIPDLPIWVSVIDSDLDYLRNDCYVIVGIRINGDTLYNLISGYIYISKSLSWPAINAGETDYKTGQPESYNGTDPAAGVEISEAVTANQIWKIRSIRFSLITAAVAATRVVHLVFVANAGPIFDCISPTSQIISETKTYSCYPTNAGAALADDNDIIIPIPSDIVLGPNQTIITQTTALNAGDNFSAPTIQYEKNFKPG